MCRNPMGDDDEISAIKDALFAQQQLLQKLYNELDAEREASASAASEALAVILRLQGEKAAVKMEAEHYKRLSEEKICHAEESLAVIEDAIYQKEMEVASLDYQVQAYRYKLLSMGCVDHGFGGMKFLDNVLQRNEGLVGETSGGSIGRRHSAPMSYRCKNASGERDGGRMLDREMGSGVVEGKLGEEMCDKDLDSEKKIDSYWEKIKRLDERVKEIAGGSYMSSRSGTRSPATLSARVSRGSSCDPIAASSARNEGSLCQPNGDEEAKSSEGVAAAVAAAAAGDNSCSTSVHDVFEVPQAEGSLKSMEKDEINGKSLEREDVACGEGVKMSGGDEAEWLKEVLQMSSFEKKLCQVSDIECRLVIVPPESSVSQFHSTRGVGTGRSEIVEDERGVVEYSGREEELKLLNEIKERVNLLHDEIRSLKEKKSSSVKEEPSLAMALLSEAMLSFWL